VADAKQQYSLVGNVSESKGGRGTESSTLKGKKQKPSYGGEESNPWRKRKSSQVELGLSLSAGTKKRAFGGEEKRVHS